MKEKFINSLKDSAIKGWNEYHILPSLTIAQAILETGWGKSSIGNNLFGIKADTSWRGEKKLVKTSEYVNGKKIYIDAWFRDYDSIYESLEDRYKFLHKPRYQKVVGEQDYKTACQEIWKAGYATDPQYPQKLIQIIEQNNLHVIDNEAFSQGGLGGNSTEWSDMTQEGIFDGLRPSERVTREEFASVIRRWLRR